MAAVTTPATAIERGRTRRVTGGRSCRGVRGSRSSLWEGARRRPSFKGRAPPRVPGNIEACRENCGARAGVDGDYLRPPRGCAPEEIRATREQFKQLYQRKAFARARETLEPVLQSCSKILDDMAQAEMRNDLAVTYHRLGKDSECLAVLAPLRDLVLSDVPEYPPFEADSYQRIAKAARYNLRLCGDRKDGGRARH